MTRVVLASASSGRLQVLRHAGIDPLVVVSGVDEDAVTAGLPPESGPGQVVCALASAKAEQVASMLPPDVSVDCVVIACDSMLWFDGELRGKPGSADAARAAWNEMAGRAGELYTGHSVLRLRDGTLTHRTSASDAATVVFGTPTPDELEAYIDSGEPVRVAGGFTIDGLGGWFIDEIEGDPSTVIGIGLALTRTLLQRAELSVADLWATNRTLT